MSNQLLTTCVYPTAEIHQTGEGERHVQTSGQVFQDKLNWEIPHILIRINSILFALKYCILLMLLIKRHRLLRTPTHTETALHTPTHRIFHTVVVWRYWSSGFSILWGCVLAGAALSFHNEEKSSQRCLTLQYKAFNTNYLDLHIGVGCVQFFFHCAFHLFTMRYSF